MHTDSFPHVDPCEFSDEYLSDDELQSVYCKSHKEMACLPRELSGNDIVDACVS